MTVSWCTIVLLGTTGIESVSTLLIEALTKSAIWGVEGLDGFSVVSEELRAVCGGMTTRF